VLPEIFQNNKAQKWGVVPETCYREQDKSGSCSHPSLYFEAPVIRFRGFSGFVEHAGSSDGGCTDGWSISSADNTCRSCIISKRSRKEKLRRNNGAGGDVRLIVRGGADGKRLC